MTSTDTRTVPGSPPRRRRWLRVLLWALALTATLVTAAFVWLAAMLAGGLDDLLSPEGPTQDDAVVVQSGERAQRALAAEPLPVAPAVAVAEQRRCEEGQHNWKIDTDYDLSCVAFRTTVSPGGGLPAFRTEALALHQRLVAEGWTGQDLDLPLVVTAYWDRRATFRAGYSPADLPTAGYVRGGVRLEVSFLAGDEGLSPPVAEAEPVFTGADGRPIQPTALVADGEYAVLLALSTEHFRE